MQTGSSVITGSTVLVTTFPQIQCFVEFFSVILLQSGYNVTEITKIFGAKC